MTKAYKTFAHEVASLKRRAEEDDDTSTRASGICCAACGLECAIAPEERTTCQKCYAVHYCSSQCLQWDWSSGGHEDVCPKKPPRKRIGFLQLQSSRRPSASSNSTSVGPTCNACGLDCRLVGTERMTCPDCEGTHYCSADCMDWDWEKGGHAQDCQRSQTTKTQILADFPIEQHKQQEKQQQASRQCHLASLQGYAYTQDHSTIEEESVQYTEYTEEDAQTRDSYTAEEDSAQQTEYTEEDVQTLDNHTTLDESRTLDDYTIQEEPDQHTEKTKNTEKDAGTLDEHALRTEKTKNTEKDAGTLDEHMLRTEKTKNTEKDAQTLDNYALRTEKTKKTEKDAQTLDNYALQGEARTRADHSTQKEPVQHMEYTEKTVDADVLAPPQSTSASVDSKYGAVYKEGETVPDEEDEEEEIFKDEGEDDNKDNGEEDETVETELETLLINHYGSLVAAYGDPYCRDTPDSIARSAYHRAYVPPPDTPETVVTSNQHFQGTHAALQLLHRQQEQEQQKYRTDIQRYYLQQEPSIPLCLKPSEAAAQNAPIPAHSAYRNPSLEAPLVHKSNNHAIGGDRSVQVYQEQYRQRALKQISQRASPGEIRPDRRTQRRSPCVARIDPPAELCSSRPMSVSPDLKQSLPSPYYTAGIQGFCQQQSSSRAVYNAALTQSMGEDVQQQPSPSDFYSLSSSAFFSRRQETSRLAPGVSSRCCVLPRGDSGLVIVPANRATRSTKIIMEDIEVATSAEASENCERNSHRSSQRSSGNEIRSTLYVQYPKRRCGIATIFLAFAMGFVLSTVLVLGLSWLNLIPGNDDSASASQVVPLEPTVAPTQGRGFLSPTVAPTQDGRVRSTPTAAPTTKPSPSPAPSLPGTKTPAPTTGATIIGPQPSPSPSVTQSVPTFQPQSSSQPTPSGPATTPPPIMIQSTSPTVTGQSNTTPAPVEPSTGPSPASPVPTSPAPATTSRPIETPTPESVWTVVGSPLRSTNELGGFGETVSIAGDFMVVSEPRVFEDLGQAHLFQRSSQRFRRSSRWNLVDRVNDANAKLFSSSVDLAVVSGTGSLFIGAKETEEEISGSKFQFGSAAYYEFNDANNWVQLGSTIRPKPNLVESGGDFGACVSMARLIRRVAVAAPESSWDTNATKTGRVYTYEYDGTDWRQMSVQPLFGSANSKLGSSMDMSADGSRLLLGAPGARSGDGSIFYYEWRDASDANPSSGWEKILSLPGERGEALGATVALLDDDGDVIAFGGPSYGDLGQGLIKVYTNTGGIWFAQGAEIIGAEDERIGKTVCGARGRVVFGTDTGTFHLYEYQENNWVKVGTGPDLGASVVSISMSEDASTVVVGLATEEVVTYELSGMNVPVR